MRFSLLEARGSFLQSMLSALRYYFQLSLPAFASTFARHCFSLSSLTPAYFRRDSFRHRFHARCRITPAKLMSDAVIFLVYFPQLAQCFAVY
jgi:hypothetical protein